MPVDALCRSCGKSFSVPDGLAGRASLCLDCRLGSLAPAANAREPSPALDAPKRESPTPPPADDIPVAEEALDLDLAPGSQTPSPGQFAAHASSPAGSGSLAAAEALAGAAVGRPSAPPPASAAFAAPKPADDSFQIRVLYDSAGWIAGEYSARLGPAGLHLRRADVPEFLIPVGLRTERLAAEHFRVVQGYRWVDFGVAAAGRDVPALVGHIVAAMGVPPRLPGFAAPPPGSMPAAPGTRPPSRATNPYTVAALIIAAAAAVIVCGGLLLSPSKGPEFKAPPPSANVPPPNRPEWNAPPPPTTAPPDRPDVKPDRPDDAPPEPVALVAAGKFEFGRPVRDVIASPDGRKALVLDPASGRIRRIDLDALTLDERVVEVGLDAVGMRASPDGRTLYVFAGEPGGTEVRISVVDAATLTVVSRFLVPDVSDPLDLVADRGGTVYLAVAAGANRTPELLRINPAERRITGRLRAALPPGCRLALHPEGDIVTAAAEVGTGGVWWSIARTAIPAEAGTLEGRTRTVAGFRGGPVLFLDHGRFLDVGGGVWQMPDAPTGGPELRGRVPAHTVSAPVTAPVAGERVLLGDRNGRVYVVATDELAVEQTFRIAGPVTGLAHAPQSGTVAVLCSQLDPRRHAASASARSREPVDLYVYRVNPSSGPAPARPVTRTVHVPAQPPTRPRFDAEWAPVARVELGEDAVDPVVSPDRRGLLFLNRREGRVGRVELPAARVAAARFDFGPGAAGLIADPAGKRVFVFGAGRGPGGRETGCRLVELDPVTLKPRGERTLAGPVPFDVAIDADGRVYVSGRAAGLDPILRFGPTGGEPEARTAPMFSPQQLHLHPDGRRLYAAKPAGLQPASRVSLPEGFAAKSPERARDAAAAPETDRRGRALLLLPGGDRLLGGGGSVWALSADAADDLKPVGTVPPFVVGAASADLAVIALVNREGAPIFLRTADLRPVDAPTCTARPRQLAVDGPAKRLYALCPDRFYGDSGTRPASRQGAVTLEVYDLSPVLESAGGR
jgi:DNA-binding beta-propeller fold protein YncE